MYRLLVSPSPFRESYVDGRSFRWFIAAWWAALWYTIAWPCCEVEIQKKVKP